MKQKFLWMLAAILTSGIDQSVRRILKLKIAKGYK